jgi:hypothetical protein
MARTSPGSDDPDPLAGDPRVRAIAKVLSQPGLILANYHRVGRTFGELAADRSVAGRGSGWKGRVAGLVSASEATLGKCLQFSRAYGPDDFGELEELGVG